MRTIFLPLILFICFSFSGKTQVNQDINITFFGSSVCNGSGAKNNQGYSWLFFNSDAIDTNKFKYFNASTGGDNTLKVEKENRLSEKLFPTNPKIVVIGLSLANEGIMSVKDDNGKELILEQYRSRLLTLADSLNSMGITPVIANCYAHSSFNDSHYSYTKKMNRIINLWKYPSINLLGTIDDHSGKWVEGYSADSGHPNEAGHLEMSYAIVPSLFEAINMGKNTPVYDWNRSYISLNNDFKIENPLSIDIDKTMHSFTMSFRFKQATNGSIAGFVSNKTNHIIEIKDNIISYKDLSITFKNASKTWTHVVLSHSYSNQKTMLFVNGKLIGSFQEQLLPNEIYFGGTASEIELKDLGLHRSSLNEDEALDLYNKKFIQSSLEFYNPLTYLIEGNKISNFAQSLTKLNVNSKVKLQYNNIPLY